MPTTEEILQAISFQLAEIKKFLDRGTLIVGLDRNGNKEPLKSFQGKLLMDVDTSGIASETTVEKIRTILDNMAREKIIKYEDIDIANSSFKSSGTVTVYDTSGTITDPTIDDIIRVLFDNDPTTYIHVESSDPLIKPDIKITIKLNKPKVTSLIKANAQSVNYETYLEYGVLYNGAKVYVGENPTSEVARFPIIQVDEFEIEVYSNDDKFDFSDLTFSLDWTSGIYIIDDLGNRITPAKEDTLLSILGQLDLTLSALRDAIKGANNKDLSTLEADIETLQTQINDLLTTLGEVRDELSLPVEDILRDTAPAASTTYALSIDAGRGNQVLVAILTSGAAPDAINILGSNDGTNFYPIDDIAYDLTAFVLDKYNTLAFEPYTRYVKVEIVTGSTAPSLIDARLTAVRD